MRDERKTKKQLVRELRTLRAKQKKLEKSTEKLRQAEEQRRQEKEQYQQLVENINEVIFSLDDGGTITYVSPAVSVLGGYAPPELSGRSFSDLILPEDLKIANSGFWRVIRGELGPSEFRMLTKSGNVRWVRSSSRPIVKQGNVVGISGALTDITERKVAEADLKNMFKWQEAIFEGSRDAVFIADSEDHFVAVNKAACNLTGYSREELLKMQIPDLHEEEDLAAYDKFRDRIMAGEPMLSEARIKRRDSTKVDTEFNNSPVIIAGIVYMHTTARDITERKRAEEELRESERRFREMLGNVDLIALTLSREGTVTFCNDYLLQLTGWKRAEVLNADWFSTFLPDGSPEVKELFFQSISTGNTPAHHENSIVTKAGELREVYWNNTFLCDTTGNIIGMASIGEDITERKRAEETLRLEKESFRHSLDESPLGMRIVTADGDTLYANRAILDLYGYDSLEELRKMPLRARYTPESYAEFQKRKQQRERGDFSTSEYEISIVRKNGEVLHLQVHRKQVRWNNAQQFLVMYQDITEPKKAKEALAESERKLKTVFEILPVGTSILNAQRKIVYVNPALERILDISRESLFKGDYRSRAYLRPDGTLMPAEEFASVRAIKEQRAVHNVEIGVVKEDGTVIWTTVSAVPLGFSDWEVLVVTSDITERKRAEEALRASEERYRRLFEGDLAGDYVSTPAGKLIACNAAFARIFRFKSIDDALATNTHELYPNPEARQLFLRSLRQNRRLELREAWLKRRDGTDLHVIENSFSVFDDKGELIEIRGYLLDDTERKRAEEELQRSEMQYRSLTENSPDLIARFDRQYCHLYVNPTAAEAGRCSPHEYVGKTIAESGVPEEEARKWEERIRTVFETGQVVDVEDSFETPKGSRNFHTKFVPEFAPDGSIHSVQSIARDITERKQAEKALQKSEERYRSLFANMLDGFAYCKMIFDDQNRPVDFVYLAVNRAFEQLSGLKDVEGKRISEVLPDVKESSPELLERYGRVALTGKPEQFEFSLKSLNQRLSISVYSTEKGYFVAVFENITERRRAEERRITSQEQLRQLAGHLQSVREEERKHLSQEFHDQLGQTLTALKMDLALLQRELADKTREVSPSTLGEKIQSMQGLIDTGIQAIREIMSELHPELLDQLGLVAALEWEAERFQKRSSLKCQFTSELEELPFDPKKSIALFRIFQEAVTNVARHAQATIVEISVRREGDDVVLEIRDNGIGIEPNAEHKARSFGLVGMRERAVLLGGTLEITGIKGRGTTILVRMPFEQTLPDGGAAL